MILSFILGFLLLLFGAELLVRGASQIAAGLGIPPLVIGLTIVAYGTGSPELVVGVVSSLQGQSDLALGNVIGSNIINILLILGLSASICPLVVHQQLIRLDVPIMIALTLLFYAAALTGMIGVPIGLLFLALLLLYTILLFFSAKNEDAAEFKSQYRISGKFSYKKILIDSLFVILGIAMLVKGSNWLVLSATEIAVFMGVSQLVISLTLVALGTSLPELATSVVAAFKGQRDIAVGNIVGSNIFNILAVVGFSALVAPEGILIPEQAIHFDIPVMVVASIACLPIFFTGHIISRAEGLLFLFYYILYNGYLVLYAMGSPLLSLFRDATIYFILPLTILTFSIGLFRHFKKG